MHHPCDVTERRWTSLEARHPHHWERAGPWTPTFLLSFFSAAHPGSHSRALACRAVPVSDLGFAWLRFLPLITAPGCRLEECTQLRWVCACQVASACPTLFNPWTIAHEAPLSLGFSRQESWSGLQCPPPGDPPHPGTKPVSLMSPALAAGSLPPVPRGKPLYN